mmetsp:Transcript_39169/g.122121  ORF Transcript_39169/g.122121 Transcript_39169/m.122121 type:complete len:313 (-) Transcript_39169:386-1324(-)
MEKPCNPAVKPGAGSACPGQALKLSLPRCTPRCPALLYVIATTTITATDASTDTGTGAGAGTRTGRKAGEARMPAARSPPRQQAAERLQGRRDPQAGAHTQGCKGQGELRGPARHRAGVAVVRRARGGAPRPLRRERAGSAARGPGAAGRARRLAAGLLAGGRGAARAQQVLHAEHGALLWHVANASARLLSDTHLPLAVKVQRREVWKCGAAGDHAAQPRAEEGRGQRRREQHVVEAAAACGRHQAPHAPGTQTLTAPAQAADRGPREDKHVGNRAEADAHAHDGRDGREGAADPRGRTDEQRHDCQMPRQ